MSWCGSCHGGRAVGRMTSGLAPRRFPTPLPSNPAHIRLPHSTQYLPCLSASESHTGHRRASTAHAARDVSRIRSATITAIVVPVMYSDRRRSARGIRPIPLSQSTIAPALPKISTALMIPAKINLCVPIYIMYLAFSLKDIARLQSAQVDSRKNKDRA